MKVIIEFDLSDQDDRYKHKVMMRAEDTEIFLHEWESQLRSIVKHREMTEEQAKIVHELSTLYYALKNEHLNEDI